MHKQAISAQRVDSSSRHASVSYRLGLLDPSMLAALTIDPLDEPCFTLLVPGQDRAITSLLTRGQFQDGAITGYYAHDLEAELEHYIVASPAKVANWVWSVFSRDVRIEGCSFSWLVGYLLGSLSGLAETDETLALVGLAHLSFLLSLVPERQLPLPYFELNEASIRHTEAVHSYRAEVTFHKARGLDFFDASRAALAGLHHARVYTCGAPQGAGEGA